ncbi:MAG: DUF3857 domain-containing transglutaminase family protein [Flavobacterium sp.]|nr:DUF3857 domain-containing transglutaminase family protein [Flavobacterium sp.]
MKSLFYCCLFISVAQSIVAQKADYSVLGIAPELKENANAVIRMNQRNVEITSQRSMTITSRRIVTILNEIGLSQLDLSINYNKSTKISKIETWIYDASGKEIKSVKRRDFKDSSVTDGGTIFDDSRVLYFDYVPINYPFTAVFESEVTTSNTAFISSWFPLEGYYISTENALLNVTFPSDLGFKYKEVNFSPGSSISKTETGNTLSFSAKNLHAKKYEDYSPSFSDIAPKVMMGLNFFNLEGVDGNASSWKDMGQWFSEKILAGTDELPETTKTKIKALVGAETDPLKKAKIIYNYVQQGTRYVSIQEGIGGWKPMLAKDVDRLGYGDCKALSNYTKALLSVVGVPAYYTRLYGDSSRMSIVPDFVSMQSNHVMLAIPNGDDYVWLECTSQTDPFGYQGTFTDDRNVLIMKPDGGQIVRTRIYREKDNSQISNGKYSITAEGELIGNIAIQSKGADYEKVYRNEKLSELDKDSYYKEYFSNIGNLKLQKINFKNDRDNVAFNQEIQLAASGYASNTGGKLMFVLNAFNVNNNSPKRYRNRENPFEIKRGFYDYDEIIIDLPSEYDIEAMPGNFEVKSKFGEYNTQILKNIDNTLTYKRTLLIKNGNYDSKEYDDYRLFREQIAKNDNAKIVLTKKS